MSRIDVQNRLLKLIKAINSLSGIPVRLYRGQQCLGTYASAPFVPDPVNLYIDRILNQQNLVNLYTTENLMFYGSIKKDEFTIVIGPVGRITLSDSLLIQLLFQLNEPRDRLAELKDYFSRIPPGMEVTQLAQCLCDLNSFINDASVSIYDIEVFNFQYDGETKKIFKTFAKTLGDIRDADIVDSSAYWNTSKINESHEFEKQLLYAISHGQVDILSDPSFFNQTISVGKLANSNDRQVKNQQICLAVLASRAAIDGGLTVEQSYTLCNIYIQKIEECTSFSDLSNLSRQIIIDYATRVHTLLVGENHSPVVTFAMQYIARNINQRIYVEEIADRLNTNRSHLSIKFKQETGMTLTDYISQQKIFEAQRLIRYTDHSLLQISNYLDFSSQSHFQNRFKKITGMTPAQYKKSCEK